MKTTFMNSSALFSKTPPVKLFFLASLPGAISMLASALYQTLDGVFVGQYLGATAFASLNLAMPFVIINFALADLIGVGSAVPISICLGKGEREEASNLFTCACLMIVAAGVVVGSALYGAAPALIRLMGAEGAFADLSVQYLRVYALSSPVTTIIFAVDNFMRISGYIRGSMLLNIFMSLLSGVLEFLFLGVFHFGIWGAALATCSGMFVCALIAFTPFFPRQSRAALLPAALSYAHGSADPCLRQPEFSQQHSGPHHLHPAQSDSGAPGRRDGRLRVWYSYVC